MVHSPLSRRSLIGVAAAGMAGLSASACSGSTAPDDAAPDRKAPASPAGVLPDVEVATSALAEIRAVGAAVTGTLSRFPESRARLAPLGRMHRVHEQSLADAVPERARPSAAPAPYVVPRSRAAALKSLTTREERLHATLDGLAVSAQSGEFARLLASMGAGVAQQLAGWES